MIVVLCDDCEEEIDVIRLDKYSSFDIIDNLRDPKNNLCTDCWIDRENKEYKNRCKKG